MSAEEKRPYELLALEDEKRFVRERDAFLLAQGADRCVSHASYATVEAKASAKGKPAAAKSKKKGAASAPSEKVTEEEADPDYIVGKEIERPFGLEPELDDEGALNEEEEEDGDEDEEEDEGD